MLVIPFPTKRRRRPHRPGIRALFAMRRAAGLCPECGTAPPEKGYPLCATCLAIRRHLQKMDMRDRTALRRKKGLCTRCGNNPPEPDIDSCLACATRDRAKALRNYRRSSAMRKASRLCVRCGKRPPERGTDDCGQCRDQQRHLRHRAIPCFPTRYTVIERRTGEDHGTWESLAEVAAALAYAKLSAADVEIFTDASPAYPLTLH